MSRAPTPSDDLDRYIAERDAREPGFAALVANAEKKRAAARQVGEQARAPDDTQTD
jgi:hypothetical protein